MSGGGSSQIIGYRYFMGLHMAIAHGPIDSLNNIFVGKREVPRFTGTYPDLPITSSGTIELVESRLFGGDEKEGGILGTLDVEFGEVTQTPNAYLTAQFGAGITPAFRGVTCCVFRESESFSTDSRYTAGDGSGGGYLAAMSPYPKPWAFDITDIPGGTFNPSKQDISGSANAGHIIYDCLTNQDWGLGLPTSNIDLATFTAVTDALHAEGFGLSMVYGSQSSMEKFIGEVLTHVNAIFFNNRKTGNFSLKLIRDDYDPNTLPIYDETNIASMADFERPAFGELVNEIVLSYRNQGDFDDSTITAQDLASVQAQGAVISQTASFPGIDNNGIAARVAQRELAQLSTPLARCNLTVNREAWDINPGDVIKLSWASYGLVEIIMRVIKVDYGTYEDGTIRLNLAEDIFALPSNTYLDPQGTGWTDEVGPPVKSEDTIAVEAPFFLIETTFLQEELNELVDSSAILQSVAPFTSVATLGFEMHTRLVSGTYAFATNGSFCPTCELDGILDEQTKLAIPIKNFSGGVGQIVIGGYAYLEEEVLRIDSVDILNSLVEVGRGYLDSIPQSHPSDSIIYFADTNSAVDPTIYEDGDDLEAKVLPQTSIGILDLADADTDSRSMVGRRTRPYSPSQVRIGNLYFPTTVTDQIAIVVTWGHQDRTQQLAIGGQDWFEVSLGSQETGVLYEVRYYLVTGSVLLYTDSDISGVFSSFTPNLSIGVATDIRVEIDSIRDGTVFNLTTFTHEFSYTRPLGVRSLEDANTRTLESGDRRTLE